MKTATIPDEWRSVIIIPYTKAKLTKLNAKIIRELNMPRNVFGRIWIQFLNVRNNNEKNSERATLFRGYKD